MELIQQSGVEKRMECAIKGSKSVKICQIAEMKNAMCLRGVLLLFMLI
jgi:hypothetical protein